ASMEPSRERDGDVPDPGQQRGGAQLQWSRRANATETAVMSSKRADSPRSLNGAVARTRRRPDCLGRGPTSFDRASMEPSRERDGDTARDVPPPRHQELQWSRRANATETRLPSRDGDGGAGLQWSRRANATETGDDCPKCGGTGMLQWSRRANATETSLNCATSNTGRQLQWSRRANATETRSRELLLSVPDLLQWSRRANATETA